VTYRSRLVHPRATRGGETRITRLRKHRPCHLDRRTYRPCLGCYLFPQSNRPPPTSWLGRLRAQEGRSERSSSKKTDSIRNNHTKRSSRHRHDSRCTLPSSVPLFSIAACPSLYLHRKWRLRWRWHGRLGWDGRGSPGVDESRPTCMGCGRMVLGVSRADFLRGSDGVSDTVSF